MYLRLQPYVPACNPMYLCNQALLLSLYPAGVDRSKPSEIAALIAALDARQVPCRLVVIAPDLTTFPNKRPRSLTAEGVGKGRPRPCRLVTTRPCRLVTNTTPNKRPHAHAVYFSQHALIPPRSLVIIPIDARQENEAGSGARGEAAEARRAISPYPYP